MSEHWFGNRTSKWKVVPLREVARLGTGHTPSRSVDEYWVNCTIPWVTVTDIRDHGEWSLAPLQSTKQHISELGLANSAAILHPAGTVMLSRTASIGFSCITGKEMATTQAFVTWTPNESMLNGKYLHAALKAMSQQYDYLAYGATHLTIYFPDIKTLRIPLPPLEDQDLIAAFLDRETAKIDELVVEQRRLMELLKEKRQAVISHAVTRGLNPDAPLKPSGIEWIGEVPDHWTVSPLKNLTEPGRPIMYGIVLPGPDVGWGIPILKGGNVKPSRMNLDAMARTTPEIEAPYKRARLRQGDLVYSIRGTIGDCEPVPRELDGANITQDVARVAVASEHCASWVRWALLSRPIREELACGSLGAAVRGVNIFDLKRVRIAVPPVAEQVVIADFIDREAAKLDDLAAEAQRAIDLLQERRTALISAAVTGQIDVRETSGLIRDAEPVASPRN